MQLRDSAHSRNLDCPKIRNKLENTMQDAVRAQRPKKKNMKRKERTSRPGINESVETLVRSSAPLLLGSIFPELMQN
jgi:predicted secreted Zn-dependent protease